LLVEIQFAGPWRKIKTHQSWVLTGGCGDVAGEGVAEEADEAFDLVIKEQCIAKSLL
jgi:hypothetical protein